MARRIPLVTSHGEGAGVTFQPHTCSCLVRVYAVTPSTCVDFAIHMVYHEATNHLTNGHSLNQKSL